MAVANNKVDVATNNTESIYARLQKTNMKAFKNIKEIWRAPLIPSDPMVWRKNLSAEVKQKIYFFIMQYGRFGSMEKVEMESAEACNKEGNKRHIGICPKASTTSEAIDVYE